MPAALTYPGVYVEEISSGVRTITGVATSITAFIGRALRGPCDEPVTINNYGDFERIFGGLWEKSTVSFAVRDFYLNGGGQSIVVRLFNPLFDNETARATAYDTAKKEAESAVKIVTDAAEKKSQETNSKPDDVAIAVTEAAKKFAITTKAAELAINAIVKIVNDAVKNGKNSQEVVQAAKDAVPVAVKEAANTVAGVVKAQLTVGGLKLEAANPGIWGNKLRARIDHDVVVDDLTKNDKDDIFNLSIKDTGTGQIELFRNVSFKKEHSRCVEMVLEQGSDLVRTLGELPTSRPDTSGAVESGADPFDYTTSCGVSVLASDGNKLDADDYKGDGKEAGKKGLYALEKVDLFNLLCIPPFSPSQDVTFWDQAAQYCEKRRAMLIVDAPISWTNKDKAKGNGTDTGIAALGTKHKNAAVFFPRLMQPNPEHDNRLEEFAPCGAVAGIMARTDTERGVWKAPAGLDAILRGVPQLKVSLTDMENGELNPLGINCLRTRPAVGRVIWGARTLQGDDRIASEWKYIPVRRTALFIEESLYRGTQWVVFEPNDEPLWAQIRLNVGSFMHNLFRKGAFQGSTPKDAYFVKCDKETNPQNDIDQGIVNIMVGFAPLKPAEFVVVKLQQIAGKLDF